MSLQEELMIAHLKRKQKFFPKTIARPTKRETDWDIVKRVLSVTIKYFDFNRRLLHTKKSPRAILVRKFICYFCVIHYGLSNRTTSYYTKIKINAVCRASKDTNVDINTDIEMKAHYIALKAKLYDSYYKSRATS